MSCGVPCWLIALYGEHHYLHSFPTRRSSDLLCVGAAFAQNSPQAAQHARPPEYTFRIVRECVLRWSCVLSSLRDRKSTRLNSSHTVISYAVFCLKKQKKCSCAANNFIVWMYS